MFEVLFYELTDGVYPAENFLLSLDNKIKAKLFRIMELLEEKGNELREPYSKHLDDGIFEIRAQIGRDAARVLYFFIDEKKIILTNGFLKKTRKTPRAEINLAKKYRKDYFCKRRI